MKLCDGPNVILNFIPSALWSLLFTSLFWSLLSLVCLFFFCYSLPVPISTCVFIFLVQQCPISYCSLTTTTINKCYNWMANGRGQVDSLEIWINSEREKKESFSVTERKKYHTHTHNFDLVFFVFALFYIEKGNYYSSRIDKQWNFR